ncbi:trypsin-like serine protease [Streptomyces sp. NPDC056488]|uniref:trypsin-like serine protease n=1 Tax=Streptomyces sp. NPDC056488 TaxID=3345836 RepID=UPI003682FC53
MLSRASQLAITSVAVAALSASIGTYAVASEAPPSTPGTPGLPFTVEDGAYPGAAQILTDKGIKLLRGDGNITLAECNATAKQIRVMTVEDASAGRAGTYCFASRAATGVLTLELPRVFAIDAADQPLSANLTADGQTKTVTLAKDGYASVGEGLVGGPRSTLVEIRVTGSGSTTPPAPTGDATLAFTGKLTIGDTKSCSAALVDPRWVITAKSCFADKPAENNTVTAGAPKEKTTVTVGRTDLATSGGHTSDIDELVPHADRDLVMARLAQPATGVTPVTVSSATPTANEELTFAGFGRTKAEWSPTKLHSASFTVTAIAESGVNLTAKAPADATVCKGDAGGPTLRTENGKPALVALGSRSGQADCFDGGAGTTGVHQTRLDNARDWIQQVRALAPGWKAEVLLQGGANLYQGIRLADGTWTGFTDVQSKAGNIGGVRSVAAAGINADTHVVALGGDGRIHHTIRKADGSWLNFGDVGSVAGVLGSVTQVSAVSIGADLHVVAVADGKVFHTLRTAAGHWSPFGNLAGAAGAIGTVTAAATASVGGELQVIAVSNGKAYHTVRATTGHWATWGDVSKAAGITGPINAVSMAGTGGDAQIVIATDNGSRQYHAIRKADRTWAGFGDLKDYLGTVTVKSLGAAYVDGEFQLTATTADGKFLHTIRHADRTWNPTVTVTTQGVTGAIGATAIAGTL